MSYSRHTGVFLVLCSTLIFACRPIPAIAAPDIIVLLADDLGATDIGPQRRKAGLLTPNIDALASAGIVYTAGYGQPACVQARTALMAGKWPQRRSIGSVINNGPQPLASMVTVAERLRALGYRTHLIGKWHLGFSAGKHPLDQGFDTFLGFPGDTPDYMGDDPLAPLFSQRTRISNTGLVTDTLGAEAVRILRSALTKPQFLFISWTAPHDPLQGTLAQRIAEMDANIGLIVAAARPGSLIIFVGDNGRWSNSPLRGKKYDILEGGVRVPFVLSWPGQVAPGQRVDTPASLVDIAPTVVKAAGGAFPDSDGFDLLALPPNRGVFFKAYYGDPGFGVRRGPWKFYRRYLGQPLQLYNVRTDLGEARNVAAANPQVVSRMSTLLNGFAAALND
jgi:arylsulfatase A-like enzyme